MQKQKYYKHIPRLCLMDDVLMAKCFAGHNECFDVLIKAIIGRDDIIIESSEIQKTLKSLWRSRENNHHFGDRSHIIYVNGEYRDEATPLGRLVHDLFCRNAGEMYYEALAQRVGYLKEETKGVKEISGVIGGTLRATEENFC